MKVKAVARDVSISPQKVRLVTDIVRGRKIDEALTILSFLPTPAAKAVAKVIKSAAASAENNFEMSPVGLRISEIFCDKGHTLKRFRPQARGRVNPILKQASHITVFIAEEES